MFFKQGSAVALMQPTSVNQWNNFKTAAQQIPNEFREVVAAVDNDCIYLHGTIVASVDLEPNSEHYIKKASEQFINDNGDAFPRDEVISRYKTFKSHSRTYAEHKQGPEHAKGRCVDVVIRNMGDTVLVDVLFTVDKAHTDLIRNIEKQIVTHLSMGCQTEFTKCSICGHLAHNEDEYCDHVKNQKRQIIQAPDGNLRKVAELCFNNTWIDISLVMNPAFGGAAIRKILSSDAVGKQVLASILAKHVESSDDYGSYENALMKAASLNIGAPMPQILDVEIAVPVQDPPYHPINNTISNESYPPTGFQDIPWNNPNDVKKSFDKDNPGNESEVEGPILSLQDVSNEACQPQRRALPEVQLPDAQQEPNYKCCKCSSTSTISNHTDYVISKCGSCGYIQELAAENSIKHSEPITITNSPEHVVPGKDDIQTFSNNTSLMVTAADGTQIDLLSKLADLENRMNSIDTKVASKTQYKQAVKDIISYLYSYSTEDQLKQAVALMDSVSIDSTSLKQAIQQYNDVDSSEQLIQATLLNMEKLAYNEDNVKTGLSLYIEKVYDKWDHRDISELIYQMFPDEATIILDEARKLHFR